jgi:hypothetical protein
MRIVDLRGLRKRLGEYMRLLRAVTLSEPDYRGAYPLLTPLVPEGTARRLIDEERDES